MHKYSSLESEKEQHTTKALGDFENLAATHSLDKEASPNLTDKETLLQNTNR